MLKKISGVSRSGQVSSLAAADESAAVQGMKIHWAGTFQFDKTFSSGMVLQQGEPIRFSGTAEPGTRLELCFAGELQRADVGHDGRWCMVFPARTAGGPALTATLAGDPATPAIELDELLIGEVWLCAGQSNMELSFQTGAARDGEPLRDDERKKLRFFNCRHDRRLAPDGPKTELDGGAWEHCSEETVMDFSAVGYFFGRKLLRDLNLPVGLIDVSWGGTDIEAWISQRKFLDAGWQPGRDGQDGMREDWVRQLASSRFRELRDWLTAFEEYGSFDEAMVAPDFDDSSWKSSDQPVLVLPKPGRYLCRLEFDLPSRVAVGGSPCVLELGVLNDTDRTWLNGTKIGAVDVDTPLYWSQERNYPVSAQQLRRGRNVLAILIDNHCNSGSVAPASFAIRCGEERWLLKGHSRLFPVFELPDEYPPRPPVPRERYGRGPEEPNCPSTLFNSMIYPWCQTTIRGILWYQGCNNFGESTYEPLLRMMIEDWREYWGVPDLPILLVQLAGFHPYPLTNENDEKAISALQLAEFCPIAVTREIQAEVARHGNAVGLISAFDCGEALNIHPRNKRTVGERLAYKAETMVYRRDFISDGPELAGFRWENGRVRVFFRNIGSGLTTIDGGSPLGFALCDRFGYWQWAQARIDGDTVVLSADSIEKPQRVRYAFTTYCRVNLINREGFPALPFRSDKPDYRAMFQRAWNQNTESPHA